MKSGDWRAYQSVADGRFWGIESGEEDRGNDEDIIAVPSMPEHCAKAIVEAHNSRRRSPAANGNGFGCVKPDTDRQVFFYEQDFYVLSNFSSFRLLWMGRDFDTSEHAYHWTKFYHALGSIEDTLASPVRSAIKNARSAHEAFKIAEENKPLRRSDWDDVKVDVMRNLIRAKAAQHEYVRRKLLATGDRELIEDSWRDNFWGWGPNREGQNMLGKLWMEVRAELRQQEGEYDGRLASGVIPASLQHRFR